MRTPLNVAELALHGRQLIEASAGTGKTWTLTQLVLRLVVERGLEPRQILVVTFTEAAKAELDARIRAALAERLRDSVLDATARARVQQALLNIDEAAIFTIHGFCRQALQELPLASGAPLQLEVLHDESELRLQAVQDHWRERVATPRHGAAVTQALAALMLRRHDSPEAWAAILRRCQQHPLARLIWPAEMDEAGRGDGGDRDDSADRADEAMLEDLVATLNACFAAARETWGAERQVISDIVDEARERLNQSQYKPDAVDRAFAEWDLLLGAESPLQSPADPKRLALLRHDRLVPKGKLAPPHPHRFFEQASALLDALTLALREDSPLRLARSRLLREMLAEAPRRMAAHKRARRLMSFDDMLADLHRALHGARGAALAAALRARHPAALIDEFQDTDALQAAIFHAIYDGHPELPLFLLGDAKQAIYAFRGADLHCYLSERAATPRRHTLATNQRSTPALLAALNALYAGHPGAFVLGDLAYEPVVPGTKRRPVLEDRGTGAAGAALELWQLPSGTHGKPQGLAALREAVAAAAAAHIARALAQAEAGSLTLDGRALAGGDIAVLVRTHHEGALMRRALAELGVASIERSPRSVHATIEAVELERVLAAWLEPSRLTLVNAALATTLMGWDAGAIHDLQDDDARLQAMLEDFVAQRQRWQQRGIGITLRRWMAEGVSARLLAQADGERRMTNLLHLAERLQQREQSAAAAPAALLHWLRAQRRDGGSDGSDATLLRLESDRQLVQIVTMHRAKGLEYPLVYLPFAWAATAGGANGEGLVYHDDEGEAVIDFREPDGAVRQRLALEARAEEQRLLYVGLTRAVHRCFVAIGAYRQGKSLKPGLHGALNSLAAAGALSAEQWLAHEQPQAFIDAAWRALAQRAAPHIALVPMPDATAPRYRARQPAPEQLQALPPPARIAPAWTVASYSSLWLGWRDEQAAADHDAVEAREADASSSEAPAEPPDAAVNVTVDVTAGAAPAMAQEQPRDAVPDLPPDAATADDDILNFPRGAAAGEALHAVFERIDFTQREAWPAVVDEVLHQHRLATPAPGASHASLRAMVLRMLGDVLDTPLEGALALARLPATRRLVELEFWLPAGRLELRALQQLMRDAGLGEPVLAVTQLEGYLRGFIDLVFEHRGRWWIVDWKSNHLGDARDGYEGTALDRVMREHGYTLQALLYAVALHRWLARRLPGYDASRHFGGVGYLFVRGMRPGWPGAGVHLWRPGAELLAAASALFAAPGGGALAGFATPDAPARLAERGA